MSILSRPSRLCLNLLVLCSIISCSQESPWNPIQQVIGWKETAQRVLCSIISCSQESQGKQAQKDIGWKEVAQKINELEKVKKETLDALAKKAQARTTATPTRKQEDALTPKEYKIQKN